MKYLCVLFCLMASSVWAQETLLLRQPTVHSETIVFVYADDLWQVPIGGGKAHRLTSNIGSEMLPHFSPDGKWIAFSGQYDGNTDVYVIPSTGGEPKRLTWHPGRDLVTGWTPKGDVLFISGRESVPTQEQRFYQINPTDPKMPEALPIPRAAAGEMSSDGKYLAYQMITFFDPEWRNYRGGQAKPIWIVDTKNYTLTKTPQLDRERHTDPIWHDGKVYYLSERDYANNIWSFDPAAGAEKQMTFHADFDVKSLDAGPGGIVYEQGGRLHLLNPDNGESKTLNIQVVGDFNWARTRWESVSAGQVQNAAVSPTGKRALFEIRGEIISVPKENGSWRNLSNNSAAADRSPIWSPKGDKVAWFSDKSGEYQLVLADQDGDNREYISLPNPTFYFRPAWSPDGKYIAYTDTHYQLWVLNLDTKKTTKIDTDGYAHPNRTMNPAWSPDSKWIAYVKLLPSQYKAIMVYNLDSKKVSALTDGMADCLEPAWDKSGDYLYYLASTDYALNTGWLDMSSYNQPITRSLYAMVLANDGPNPLAPKSDEEPVETDSETEDSESEEDSDAVVIDFEGLANRTLALGVNGGNYLGLVSGPEGSVFYAESVPNEPGVTWHKYTLSDGEATPFLSGVNGLISSSDGGTILYQGRNVWGMVGSGSPSKMGQGALNLSAVSVKVNPAEEWKQIYKEGWRFMRDFLYVDNTHGAPWDEVYSWYAPWIDHVRHRSDLNYVVDMMSGEVAVGHSYTYGGDVPSAEYVPVGVLGADYEVHRNRYRITKIYTGEQYNPTVVAPLSGPGLKVKAGNYLVGIGHEEITADKNLYQYFEGTAGEQVTLWINDKPSRDGAWSFVVKPTWGEAQLRRWDWVEGNRRKVDELSGGKLAYVYVPNTSGQGYQYFNRYYFAQQDKAGAVIDERNNGGGSAADYMVDIMARDLHGYFNSKSGDRRPFTTPMAGIWGPKVMVMNERAGSGGDLLPYLFRKMEIGPLIGTRTWGGLVGTWDTPQFVDGGVMVAPRGGFYDLNGEWAVEGVGVAPDIEVHQTPADVIAGKDPQLERAVAEALELLKTESVELKPEPAAPIRYFRPKGK